MSSDLQQDDMPLSPPAKRPVRYTPAIERNAELEVNSFTNGIARRHGPLAKRRYRRLQGGCTEPTAVPLATSVSAP